MTFVKDKQEFSACIGGQINFEIYKNRFSEEHDIFEYKDWQISLARRFHSLKIWWVIRSLGIRNSLQLRHQRPTGEYS
jgi:hypothetical protein